MAEESKGDEIPPAVEEGAEPKQEANKNGKGRGKKDDTPIEELFDLSQPIPKVREPLIFLVRVT
jgi:hypothetical protein